MKKLCILLCSVLLVFGMSGVAGAVPTWATDVDMTTGWLDADKNWVGDNLLCWAASASNLLSWGGWDGGPGLVTEDQIFDEFKNYWTNQGTDPYYGVHWWFTGINLWQGIPGPNAQLTNTSHTGFYSQTLFDNNYAANMYTGLDDLADYLAEGRAVGIGVEQGTTFHALTVWGVDPVTGDLWLTDSDLNIDTLDHYTVTGANLDGLYAGWQITRFYGLRPVPEPATILLLGAGLIGLAGFRKKFRKR